MLYVRFSEGNDARPPVHFCGSAAGALTRGTERTRPEDASVREMTKVEEWKQLSADNKNDLRSSE